MDAHADTAVLAQRWSRKLSPCQVWMITTVKLVTAQLMVYSVKAIHINTYTSLTGSGVLAGVVAETGS